MTDTNTINVINAKIYVRLKLRNLDLMKSNSNYSMTGYKLSRSGSSCLEYYFLNSHTHITMLWTIVMNAYNFCTITVKAPQFFSLEGIHKTLD